MKQILIDKNDNKDTQKYFNEIEVFKQLHHINLIQYSNSFIHKNKLCIVMEYAENGDLSQIIKKYASLKQYIPEEQIWTYFIQICRGLNYIHSKKIIHRDIKTQNIFLSKDNVIKVGDFGISKILKNTYDFCKTPLGTPYFLSPEICSGKTYDYKSDVWMLGCVLYELMTLKRPFDGDNLPNLMRNILRKEIKDLPKNYSNNLKWLVKKLLSKNDRDRPYIKDILNYSFVKEKNEQIRIESRSTIETENGNSDGDDEIIENSDSDIDINDTAINRKQMFSLKHENIESVIKETEEEYNTSDLMLTLKEDNTKKSQEKNKQNFVISQSILMNQQRKKKRTSSCDNQTMNNIIQDLNPVKEDNKKYIKKHIRHISMITEPTKVSQIQKTKTISNNGNSLKFKYNNIFSLEGKNKYIVKSSPSLHNDNIIGCNTHRNRSSTLYTFIKQTPKKYTIRFESSPEVDKFTIEDEEC